MTDEKPTSEEIEQRITDIEKQLSETPPSRLYGRGGNPILVTNETVKASDDRGKLEHELEDLKRQKDSYDKSK